ncbi:hypothetical protein [Mesorhizobium retamae]|uniref:Uncharacterized protein n=1 Tax=Mesorhizobium retamae TaxID=2912854 RepID=A0ABS9QEE0_9HYPH|nr:hypothetical protein [Mesorhizobium sp. IRAMC:0171]
MKSNSRRRPRQPAGAKAVADLMLAPAVVMLRLPVMAAEASGLGWREESVRAISEKMAAVAEGVAAAQLSLVDSFSRFWPEVMTGRAPSLLNGVALERSVHAALKPASRRVKANFKRLGK